MEVSGIYSLNLKSSSEGSSRMKLAANSFASSEKLCNGNVAHSSAPMNNNAQFQTLSISCQKQDHANSWLKKLAATVTAAGTGANITATSFVRRLRMVIVSQSMPMNIRLRTLHTRVICHD